MNGPRTLLIDIETAPALAYIWGLKTRYVPLDQVAEDGYMLCFAAAWRGAEEIEFWSEWDQGEEAMVEAAWELLDEAEIIIHYNGVSFDIPRLNAEFLGYKMGPPSPSHHVDLYRTANNQFRVLSRSMRHLLKICSIENKLDHKGMALWTGCMDGVAEDQADMEAYNLRDVEALDELYDELLPWITGHPNIGLWLDVREDGKKYCDRCGSTDLRFKGYKRTLVLSYRQYRCNSCGSYPRERFAEEVGKNRRTDILRGS